MSIQANCHCGAQFMAELRLAGKSVRCPSCGQSFQVPKPAPPPISKVACPCGKVYSVQPALYGRPVRCQACGRQFVVPKPRMPGEAAPVQTPVAAADPLGSFDPLGASGPLGYSDPLAGLGDTSSWGIPASTQMSAPMAAPSYAIPQPKRKAKSRINPRMLGLIGLGTLSTAAIVAIAIAAFIWWPFSRSYASPQAVFDAHTQAALDHDWKTLFDTLTPDSQSKIVGMLVFLLRNMGQGDADVKALLDRHGIASETATPANPQDFLQAMTQMQQQMENAASEVTNKRAFFVDALSQMEAEQEEMREQFGGGKNPFGTDGQRPELKDVVIEGDRATGKQSMELLGRQIDRPVHFQKIDGGWRVDMQRGAF